MTANDTQSAMLAAMSLPELLERIIVQLPMRDIIANATRVSTTWQAMINSSQAIRHKVFLKSKYTPSTIVPINYVDSTLEEIVPEYPNDLMLNPILCDRIDDLNPDFRLTHMQITTTADTLPPINLQHFMGKDSKYQEMFLTDPPCSTVYVQRYYYEIGKGRDGMSEHDFDMIIRSPKGVTFGLLADIISESCKNGVHQDGLPVMFVVLIKDLCKPKKLSEEDSKEDSDED